MKTAGNTVPETVPFVDRTTGEMLELTTPGQVGAHLARPGYANVTMCTYVLPRC